MNKSRFVTIVFLLGFFFTGCNLKNQGKATIAGKLSGAAGERLILQELDTKEIHNLDSVIVDNGGAFTFSVMPAERSFYLLQATSGKVLVLALDKGETVHVSGAFQDFPDATCIDGTPDNLLLQNFFAFTRKNEHRVDSLENLLVERQDSSDYYQLTVNLDTAFKQIWEQQRTFEKSFLDKNSGSLVSLIVLNYAFGMSPVLSPEEDSAYYINLDTSLNKAFSENKHVKYHRQRIQEFRRQQEVKTLKR